MGEDIRHPTHYVGIGASAGGLEAIEEFFDAMPPANGLAFVVVQHLSPDYKSLMAELLSKRTQMPVHRIESGMTAQADSVYLIPPKTNLTIFHGRLLLSEQDPSRGINLPIDIFFRSLAEDQGDKAIGVVLSGTGSDGTRGVRAIKEAGGTVIVQSPESAKFDGMPRSASAAGLADFVLSPDKMARQLLAFVGQPRRPPSELPTVLLSDEDNLHRIFSLLRDRTKVDFTYYKPSTVLRRLERRMTVNQMRELAHYVTYLQSHPGEIDALYRELLIGVTSFFRDPEAYGSLREAWLPRLLDRAKGSELRFWVAGCSTGEEAYSLAMLLADLLEERKDSTEVKIFATDVDRAAVAHAGAGLYPASIAADLPPDLVRKYFSHREDGLQIVRSVREMVVFAQHNVIKDPPFTNLDLISCRNLLIYLQPVLQRRVLELFNFSLNPGGLLFLGTSETTGEMADNFELLHHKWKIYRSRGRRSTLEETNRAIYTQDLQRDRRYVAHGAGGARPLEEDRILERFVEGLSPHYLPLALIVSEEGKLVHVVGDGDGLLTVPRGRVRNEAAKMVHRDLGIPLATGLQRAFSKSEVISFQSIRLGSGAEERTVQMRIIPLPARKGQENLAAVLIADAEVAGREAPTTEMRYDAGEEAENRIMDLEQELQFTKENLQATIEELETSNEELQATNEELLASNEELQSTNEELQSVNEELHTVNAEYQSKIMELTELTNDIDNLMASTDIGTLFLGEDLEIRRYTPRVADMFRIVQSDIGRPLGDLSHRLVGGKPMETIRQVLKDGHTREEEVCNDEGRWFLLRALPYVVPPDIRAGVVVTLTDITQLRAMREELREQQRELEHTATLAKVGSWHYDVGTGEHRWSRETFAIHDLPPGRQPAPEEGLAFYAEQSRPIIAEAFRRACEQGEPYDLVLELVTAKGNRRWVRTIASPVRENGAVRRIDGAFQDITHVRETELALEASRADSRRRTDVLLEESRAFLRTLSGWNEKLLTEADPTVLFEEKCRILEEAARYDGCWIATGDGRKVFGTQPLSGPVRAHIRDVLECGESDCEPTVERVDEGWVAIFPLSAAGRMEGALALLSANEGYGKDELELIRLLADTLGFGLAHYRMLDSRRNEE